MQERFLQLLEDMDVPPARRSVEVQHLRWLSRNLGVRNGEHPHFAEAVALLRTLLREAS
jgi:hypothetical protein